MVALAWVSVFDTSASGAAQTSARMTLVSGGAITHDGVDLYEDNVNCVHSFLDARRGTFFLRTISYNNCGNVPALRLVSLDFGAPVGTLANCDDTSGGSCAIEGEGSFSGRWLDARGLNLLPDVRIEASTLFTKQSTPVVLYFDLGENYLQAGGQDTQFSLQFLSGLPVTDARGGFRTVTNDGGILARLSRLNARGKFVKVGDYVMPFSLSAGPS